LIFQNGELMSYDRTLESQVNEAIKNGMKFTLNIKDCIVTVPTPIDKNKSQ